MYATLFDLNLLTSVKSYYIFLAIEIIGIQINIFVIEIVSLHKCYFVSIMCLIYIVMYTVLYEMWFNVRYDGDDPDPLIPITGWINGVTQLGP